MQLCDYSLNSWLEKRNNDKDLMESIKTNKHMLQKYIDKGLNIFKQILDGIDHVHSLGIIHRDLKPSNIFICDINKDGINDNIVKIGGFGLATHKIITNKHSNGIGTLVYSSPEQINSNHYDNKTDIYSLGLILFEILYPMKTSMEKINDFQMLKNGELPIGIDQYIPDNLKTILLKMLTKDQNDRITLSEIRQLI